MKTEVMKTETMKAQTMKPRALSPEMLHRINAYCGAANYLSVGQISRHFSPNATA